MQTRDDSPEWIWQLSAGKFLQIIVPYVCLMGSDEKVIPYYLISSWLEVKVVLMILTVNCIYCNVILTMTHKICTFIFPILKMGTKA